MPNSYRIRVTKSDVLNSVRGDNNAGRCAIANALKRQYPNLTYPAVGYETIGYSDPATGERYTFKTPRRIREFLRDFDAGTPVSRLHLPTLTLNEQKATEVRPMNRRPRTSGLHLPIGEVRARRTHRRHG